MKEKVELRVDGYTHIDTIEIESGTVYIPAYASPFGCEVMFTYDEQAASEQRELRKILEHCMRIAGIGFHEVEYYAELMRRDLSALIRF